MAGLAIVVAAGGAAALWLGYIPPTPPLQASKVAPTVMPAHGSVPELKPISPTIASDGHFTIRLLGRPSGP